MNVAGDLQRDTANECAVNGIRWQQRRRGVCFFQILDNCQRLRERRIVRCIDQHRNQRVGVDGAVVSSQLLTALFEQMKGRGVRVMADADFQAVSPDGGSKTEFVVIDCVGVLEAVKA